MKSSIILITTLILLVFSCKKENLNMTTNKTINNTDWNLIAIVNKETNEENAPPDDINITLTFFDSIIVSSAVCNTGQGIYTTSKDSIKIDCAFTKMYCKLMRKYPINWESVYTQSLNLSTRFKRNEDELLLYSSGEYNLKFKFIIK
jgi:heat shock protein HslJ